jgi:serine/threonine-protein kinase
MGLEIGDTIDGKYRIVKLLGEGGMGAVYEGENLRIHRRVAIKILHSNVAESDDAVQRFEREAQAAGRIGSEHIVEVLDLGDLPSGERYMVMEFLDGEALNDRIKNAGKISPQATASIIIDMLEGLKAAHAAEIIHRDLKPDNVFLLTSKGGKKDFVKIVDFGISKFSSLGGEFSMTRTGAVMGTPYYLSPEQAKGERNLDNRSDLYAVGVILYEAAAGRVPFDGETFNELLFKIVLEPVPPLSTYVPDVDEHFAAIVEKSMARDPDMRFQSAEEMQEALAGWLQGQPPAPELLADASAVTEARAAMGSQTAIGAGTINRTNGAWANTNSDDAGGSSNKKWIIAAAAVLLLAGGGGVFAMNSQAEAEARAAAQAQQAADEARAEQESQRKAELAKLEAEKAQAEAERAKADQARSEAEQSAAQAQLSAAEQKMRLQAEAKQKEEDEAKAKAAAQRAAAARRKAKPTAKPKPSVGGRKIRTDF